MDDTVSIVSDTYHIHSNRLLALGGSSTTSEGVVEHYGSRLYFSEYGNLSDWRGNFIELGQKDAGHKVAIESFKSIIVCLFSNAVHFIDGSGGAASSWRILGGHLADGCLSKNHVAETPFGIAWCGKRGVYLFNGEKTIDLTLDKVQKRYIDSVADIKILAYNNIKKQLWVIGAYADNVGTDVLVYDFTGNSWHTHTLGDDELENVYELRFFDDIDSEKYYANVSSGKIKVGTPFVDEVSWSIDSGPDAIGRQGITKKIKKIYFSSNKDGNIGIKANASQSMENIPTAEEEAVVAGSNKIRTNGKGSFIRLVAEADDWNSNNFIDSIEISYKPKKIK